MIGSKQTSEQELFTVPQFLLRYSISRTTFYQLVKEGEIRIVKIGTATRISREDANAWVDSLRISNTK